MNLTPETATTPVLKGWKDLQATLKGDDGGERHPFFPLRDVQSGQKVTLTVTAGPFFENLHGQFSICELDVLQGKAPFRLCVSGNRLASAIARVEPGAGDVIELTPNGDGKNRTWAAKLA